MDKERFFIDEKGNFLGSFIGGKPDIKHIEVNEPPENGQDIFKNKKWIKNKLSVWQAEINRSDILLMNRTMEDIISTFSTTQFDKLPKITQDKYNEKVLLRSKKPKQE